MQWNSYNMSSQEPLIQQGSVKSQMCCVDRNFLNLESSLIKWQSTSDAVRRLTHLGYSSRKFINELT